MTSNTTLAHFYRSVLPSIQDQPLPKMPKTLYGYVLKISAHQQVRLCLLTILVFPLTLVPLELQRRLVDGAIAGKDLSLLIQLGVLYLIVVVGHGMLKFLRNIYLNRVAEGVIRLLRLRIAGSDRKDSDPDDGTSQSILSSEAENIGGFVGEAIAFPLLQAGIIVSVAGYMLIVDPLVSAVAFLLLAPSLAVMALSQPVLNKISEKKITSVRELGQTVLSESDDKKNELAGDLIEKIYRLRLRFGLVKFAAKGLNNLINQLGPLSVLVVGGWFVIEGRAEVGTIVAFMSGYERMAGPARDLLNFYRRQGMMRVQYDLVHNETQSQ